MGIFSSVESNRRGEIRQLDVRGLVRSFGHSLICRRTSAAPLVRSLFPFSSFAHAYSPPMRGGAGETGESAFFSSPSSSSSLSLLVQVAVAVVVSA